jgi:charged multivesicular body protein 6
LEVLEKLTADLEFAQVQQKVLEGLKVGSEALKKVHEILTIDEVERIMDETREGIDKQREIDEIISGALSDTDEDEVAAELEALIGAKEDEKVEEDISDKLPDVPTEEPVPEKRRKEKVKEPQGKIALEA